MLAMFLHSFLFLLVLPFVLFLPGWALLKFVERKQTTFSSLERIVLSMVLSIGVVDFLFLTMDGVHIPITHLSVLASILGFSFIFFWLAHRQQTTKTARQSPSTLTSQYAIPFVILFATIVIFKLLFALPNVTPNATDLGHHMYWVKQITLEGKLPIYQEREITQGPDGTYSVGDPQPISDFIIGEHLTLAALGLLSGMDVMSAYPLITLLLIHLMTVVAIFVLALRLFETTSARDLIALLALLLFGIMYAFGPPQMKYISGGVVGNTIGNLFIPGAILFLIIAFRERRTDLLVMFILTTLGLAYTHHLSTLVFGLILILACILFTILNFRQVTQDILPLFIRPTVLLTIVLSGVYFFGFWTPSYITNHAATTVIGTATDAEHQGLSLNQLKFALGEPRFIFGLLGLLLLLITKEWRRQDVTALFLAWAGILSLMILRPDLTHIDLPSARVSNYLILPFTLLTAFDLAWLFEHLRQETYLPSWLRSGTLMLLIVFMLHNGLIDNTTFLKNQTDTYANMALLKDAAEYTAKTVPESNTVIHDHINILGDTWIKLFFMRDYNYPFYRALLFRYDRPRDKQERCTLLLLSTPNTDEALKCAKDLNVRALLVNEKIDGPQFKHFDQYWQIYSNGAHSVYWYHSSPTAL